MASSLRPHPPEHHGPSHAADLARSDSLDRPVGRLPGPQQRWGTRRANPLAGVAPTGRFGGDVALGASCFLCVYLWVMIRLYIALASQFTHNSTSILPIVLQLPGL